MRPKIVLKPFVQTGKKGLSSQTSVLKPVPVSKSHGFNVFPVDPSAFDASQTCLGFSDVS
jgi:hypothetical protein